LPEPPIHGHAAPHLSALVVLTGAGAWDGGAFFPGLVWLASAWLGLVWLKKRGCLILAVAGRTITWLGPSPGIKFIDLHDRLR